MTIPNLESKRSESLLNLLEGMRQRVERGEILSLAVVYETNDDCYGHDFAGRNDTMGHGLAAELALAQFSYFVHTGRVSGGGVTR